MRWFAARAASESGAAAEEVRIDDARSGNVIDADERHVPSTDQRWTRVVAATAVTPYGGSTF